MLPSPHSFPLSPISLQTLVFDGRPGTIMSSSICRARHLNVKDCRCRMAITLQHQHFLLVSPKQHQASNTHVTPAAARQNFVPQKLPLFPLFPLLNLPSAGVPKGASPHLGKFRRGKRGKRGHSHSPSAKGKLENQAFLLEF